MVKYQLKRKDCPVTSRNQNAREVAGMKRNALLKAFGMAIATRRRELRLTQEQLAKRVNLHRTYLGDVEAGRRNVSLLNIFAITIGLEWSPAQLLDAAARNAGFDLASILMAKHW